ncbi:hypothetical protein HNY73_009152 [Argiope bruennichi]|uniref:Uncharacterized protein n=1 Tax=Argiope bruennichi TaxID=94029 RepID=A0A8T0FE57_ARGBR|nr:hypothetical protein HNY73_009152 [Argiope bruennichi]
MSESFDVHPVMKVDTSAGSFSRIIDEDHTDLFHEREFSKYSTNTRFASSEINRRILENSSEVLTKAYPRKISVEKSTECIAKEIVGVDFVSKQLQLKQNAISINASDKKTVKISRKLLCKSSEPQKKSYPREILAEESIQYGTVKNTFYANCSDFASTQLHSKHRACPSNASNLNAITFERSRDKPSEIQKTTERTQVTVSESFPNRDSSARLSWWDRIRGMLYQELIGLITEEFIGSFQGELIYVFSACTGESFQFYLFENMIYI